MSLREISRRVGLNRKTVTRYIREYEASIREDPEEDKIITNDKAVILKSTASPIVMTLVAAGGCNNFDGNSLLSVNDPNGLTADDPSTTYVLNKGSQGVGFYKLKAGKTVGMGKAYLTYPSSDAPSFLAFDETTDITTTDFTDYTDKAGAWYTLDGRKLQGNPTTKGLYIVNGRKVVIKYNSWKI